MSRSRNTPAMEAAKPPNLVWSKSVVNTINQLPAYVRESYEYIGGDACVEAQRSACRLFTHFPARCPKLN